MKTLFGIVVLIVCLMWLGWISFSGGDGQPSVTFDTEEVKDDAAAAAEVGNEILEEGQDFIENVGNTDDDPNDADGVTVPKDDQSDLQQTTKSDFK